MVWEEAYIWQKQMDVEEEERKSSVQYGFKKSPTSTGKRLEDLKEIALNRNVWKKVAHDVTWGHP